MNRENALAFLQKHQPMPPDIEWTEELIQDYKAVRNYFLDNPDPTCIPLFLNSFGEGDGLGIYVIVDEVLWQFSPEQVIPHLIEGMQSEFSSIRYWCADIATEYPNLELIEPLTNLLKNSDSDLRSAAIIALEMIPDSSVDILLAQALEHESDHEVSQLLADALKDRNARNMLPD